MSNVGKIPVYENKVSRTLKGVIFIPYLTTPVAIRRFSSGIVEEGVQTSWLVSELFIFGIRAARWMASYPIIVSEPEEE